MHEYYSQSAVTEPAPKVYVDSAVTTKIEDVPEPIHNVFEGGDDAAADEKTVAPIGPVNDVKMQESTSGANPVAPSDAAPIPADDRAPVGLDAGALEVTGAAHDEGGWHGGANEDDESHQKDTDAKANAKADARAAQPPKGAAREQVPAMDLDEDAKKLAEDALRADA